MYEKHNVFYIIKTLKYTLPVEKTGKLILFKESRFYQSHKPFSEINIVNKIICLDQRTANTMIAKNLKLTYQCQIENYLCTKI